MSLNADDPGIPELMQQAIDWLVRLRSDDISEAETYAFADWLSQDALHADAFAKAENVFSDMVIAAQSPAPIAAFPAEAGNPRGSGIAFSISKHSQPRSHPSTQRYSRWLAAPLALAAVWLFAVVLILPRQSHLLDDVLSDYHTSTGELRDIQLTDGSHLLLNTNTAVSVNYQESLREITLHHGQARFTVAKDTQRPFEVKTDGLTVRALGTVFEVYKPETREISITVQEHSIAARLENENNSDRSPSITVQEGQKLTYAGNGSLHQPYLVDLSQTSAWQQRRLFINDRPLGDLVAELDRYRVGRIFLSDDQLKNLRVTGVFSLANPDEVLNKVRKVLALQETRLGSWWILLHR